MHYNCGSGGVRVVDRKRTAEADVRRVKFWRLAANHQEGHIFGVFFRRAIRFTVDKILAKLCRANSPDVTKDLCKVLLGLEATGNGHVQYPRIGSTQHPLSTLKPLAQNKLMRGLAR